MSEPLFMADDLPATEPDLGSLAVGSEVVVVQASFHQRRVKDPHPMRGVVTSKARVWITVQQILPPEWATVSHTPRTWRLRLDDQTDGSASHYATRFYTPDQYRFRQALNAATGYLAQQGLRPDWQSPWHTDRGRTVELARAVWVLARDLDSQESGGER